MPRPAGALRRVPPVARVFAVVTGLLLLTAALLPRAVAGPPPVAGPDLPWWLLTVLFAVVEVCVLHVQVRREAQTVSLCEIPLVLGLFFCEPWELLLARVVGPVLVFAFVRRQPLFKLTYNAALLSANISVALVVFTLLHSGPVTATASAWSASYAAVAASGVLDAVATTLVIAAFEGQLDRRALLREPVVEAVRATGVATIALVAVYALTLDVAAAVLLVAVVGILLVAYRAYAALSERHLSLERLYQFSQVVSSSPEVDEVLRSVLAQAKEMLRAEAAEITFLSTGGGRGTKAVRVVLPQSGRLQRHELDDLSTADWMWARVVDDERPVLLPRGTKELANRRFLQHLGYADAVLAPLRGEAGVVGTLLVGDRLGDVRTFDGSDVRLLETVANHAGVALQNGRLIDQLRHDALHDALTGLPNRVYLQCEAKAALEALSGGVTAGCVVALMDLNGFKEVNDTLGHQQGDQLLIEVARRLQDAAPEAVVARLGGDEFAFLLPAEGSVQQAVRVARRVLHALEQPVDLDGLDVQVGASIGLAVAPQHADDATGLLKRADLAMYDAKGSGAGVRVYEAAMDTTDPQRLTLVSDLRSAIEREELVVQVQPKARLDTGEVTGVEALVRWTHPVHGAIPPDEFVPVAERSGLIRPLTMLVLRRSLEACAQWQRLGSDISVAVNLSARSLVDLDLVEDVARLLRRYGVPARLLTLEITESSVMTDPARAMGLLVALQNMGVRLSIDDFGTGYSSLSYLKRLPVHEVKIDRSFITNVASGSDDTTIVRSIIDLASNLSLEVVAEGWRTRPPGITSPPCGARTRRATTSRGRCRSPTSPAGWSPAARHDWQRSCPASGRPREARARRAQQGRAAGRLGAHCRRPPRGDDQPRPAARPAHRGHLWRHGAAHRPEPVRGVDPRGRGPAGAARRGRRARHSAGPHGPGARRARCGPARRARAGARGARRAPAQGAVVAGTRRRSGGAGAAARRRCRPGRGADVARPRIRRRARGPARLPARPVARAARPAPRARGRRCWGTGRRRWRAVAVVRQPGVRARGRARVAGQGDGERARGALP